MSTLCLLALLLVGVAALVAQVPSASAAWGGMNGRIFFVTYFSSDGTSADTVFSMNADGSDIRELYWNGTQFARQIEMSPDGTRFVVNIGGYLTPDGICHGGQGSFGCPLAIIGADGSRLGGYSPGRWDAAVADACPSSPLTCWVASGAIWLDDTHLVFNESDGTLGTVALNLDLATGAAAPFAAPFPADLGRSPISPDGRKQVYMAPDANGVQQVFVANADGSGPVQLTSIAGSGPCSPVPPTAPAHCWRSSGSRCLTRPRP